MLFFWRIRYLDSRDKQWKNRDLYLDTNELSPAKKILVESASEVESSTGDRWALKFRDLFQEDTLTFRERLALGQDVAAFSGFCVPDYFEDENGKPIPPHKMGAMLTGDPNVISFPSYYRPHDIELCLSSKPELDFNKISLTQDEVDCFALFVRDVKELCASEFHKNNIGTLTVSGGSDKLETPTTPDEIRSFVTVFRRLYMTKEPGCFVNAVTLFANKVPHPLAKWMQGELADYEHELKSQSPYFLARPGAATTFTCKKILDAFIYGTHYAHQPQPDASRKYRECLTQVRSEAALEYDFFVAMRCFSSHFTSSLTYIDWFLTEYCKVKKVKPSFSVSGLHEQSGLGAVEKKEAKINRILKQRADELGSRLWEEAGRPAGELAQYRSKAEGQLRDALT